MKKNIFLICIILFAIIFKDKAQIKTQEQISIEDIFKPKMPAHRDTFYYPFYHGVQMIEVDHIGYWDKYIYFLEQSQPRAMPHSMFHPMPIGNEYIFRDTNNTIIKAYNSGYTLKDLTEIFKKIPLEQKSAGFASFYKYHSNQGYRSGVWYQSPQSRFQFNGKYKVSTKFTKQTKDDEKNGFFEKNTTIKYGLIDSLGNEIIPLEYDEIYPLEQFLLVQKNKKCGIISTQNKVIVPIQYANFEIDHYAQHDEAPQRQPVFFQQFKDSSDDQAGYTYALMFSIDDSTMHPLDHYDRIHFSYAWNPADQPKKRYIPIEKNGQHGFLNENYEEIVAPEYAIFEFHRNQKGLFRVSKNGKFGFLNQEFKEIIPIVYDYAEPFGNESTALVLKDGVFFRINSRNIRQSAEPLKPNWKESPLNFIGPKNYIQVKTSDRMGIFDTVSRAFILPLQYKTFTPFYYRQFVQEKKEALKSLGYEVKTNPDMTDEILFHQHKIIVKNSENQYGVIDNNLNTVLPFIYLELNIIPYDLQYLICIIEKGKKEAIDLKGKKVLTKNYEEIRYSVHYEQERDIFHVKHQGKWGVVNFKEEVLVPCMYDSIHFLGHWNRPKEKLWVVEKNHEYGVVNAKNEIFVPFQKDWISHLEGHNLWLNDENKKRYKIYFGK